jgi:hypothetical protein
MKRLPVIMAAVAVLAVLAFVLRPGREPIHVAPPSAAGTVNPACRIARNVTDTYQPEPNRADALAAQRLAGSDKQPDFIFPLMRRQYGQAFVLLQKIDDDGTVALAGVTGLDPEHRQRHQSASRQSGLGALDARNLLRARAHRQQTRSRQCGSVLSEGHRHQFFR